MGKKPEDKAREQIDGMLEQAGWAVQDFDKADIHSYPGVVIRYFPLKCGHGTANYLDPDARSRNVFSFHRPETLTEWLTYESPVELDKAAEALAIYEKPFTLRARLCHMPLLSEEGLWPAQINAIKNLEKSFAANRPLALIQMATGSGKTFTAVTAIYRMIKFAKPRSA